MEQVINGLKYNTETSERIVGIDNGCNYSDFQWEQETLYRTKKARWFLHCEGGPRSQYTTQSGNMTSGATFLEALSDLEAKNWLLENQQIEFAEQYFGAIEEA